MGRVAASQQAVDQGADLPREAAVRPWQLVLRCYVRRSGRARDRWIAHCIDLDLWAVGSSSEAARRSLEDAIRGYILTVLDTDDLSSIPALLERRAPLRFVLLWHLIRLLGIVLRDGHPPLGSRSFKEPVPFRLAAA